MTKYSKINFVYFMQKWMDSVPGQTFLNYAYSWGAAIVILGTLFKLTHLPGANLALFLGMGTEVFVFFISAFDRPFDKSTIDMPLDNHMEDDVINGVVGAPLAENVAQSAVVGGAQPSVVDGTQPVAAGGAQSVVIGSGQPAPNIQTTQNPDIQNSIPAGGTIIIGNGIPAIGDVPSVGSLGTQTPESIVPSDGTVSSRESVESTSDSRSSKEPVGYTSEIPSIGAPAPAVSVATAKAMEAATETYVERLEQLNETLEKVEQLSSRLATDSEEMENLNRTLTGIARVYEMQLKSASQQITTQDSINEQTRIMSEKIKELNAIYARMIDAMTVNMPK